MELCFTLCERVQNEPLDFKAAINELAGGKKIEKLAEGSFKEVFLCGSDVIQVMPVEGSMLINEELPMSAEKVIPEVTSYVQLSRLRSPTPALNDPEGEILCFCFSIFFWHVNCIELSLERTCFLCS